MQGQIIAVIILNFHTYSYLYQALQSVKNSLIPRGKTLRIVVVDMLSSPPSLAKLKADFPSAEVLPLGKNLGCAAGYNAGIRHILGMRKNIHSVLLMNADVEIERQALNRLVLSLFARAKTGMVAPKILYQRQQAVIDFAGGVIDEVRYSGGHRGHLEIDVGQYDSLGDTEYATMAAVLVKRDIFTAIGLLDESFFLYYEDVDFSQRAKKAGFDIIFAPKAVAYHRSSSSHRRKARLLKEYYLARNVILCLRKHAPVYDRLRAYVYSFKDIIILFTELAFRVNNKEKSYRLKGMIDGLRGINGQFKGSK